MLRSHRPVFTTKLLNAFPFSPVQPIAASWLVLVKIFLVCSLQPLRFETRLTPTELATLQFCEQWHVSLEDVTQKEVVARVCVCVGEGVHEVKACMGRNYITL